jgi:hypothetical protein
MRVHVKSDKKKLVRDTETIDSGLSSLGSIAAKKTLPIVAG